MRRAFAVLLACAGAAAGAPAEPAAQIPADRSYLEFTSPVRIPGATLAPGMYLFVIGTPIGGQAIVDVYSADGASLLATCLTIESTLARPAAATTIDFPGPTPPALRAWFHPTNAHGLEFVYSQREARALFAGAALPVAYSAFTAANRALVGAIPIARITPVPRVAMAGAAAVAPSPVGTPGATAIIEDFDEVIGPHTHLTAARRVIAAAEVDASPEHRDMLQALRRQVAKLQAAYRRGDRSDTAESLRLLEATVGNLMPNESAIAARRQARMPRAVTLVLERVQAHVRAFAETAAPTLGANPKDRPRPSRP